MIRTDLAFANQNPPPTWPWVTLGEICTITIGKTPSRKDPDAWGGTHPWAKISDLSSDTITKTSEMLSDKGASICEGRLQKKGTLLFSFKLTIGKTSFAGIDIFTNEAIAGLVPFDLQVVSPRYLRYALSTVDHTDSADHAAKGKTLNKKKLAQIRVPLPPIDEQLRIIDFLDQRFDSIELAKRSAVTQLKALEALRIAYLTEAIVGELD